MNSHSPVWLSHLFQAKQMGQDRQPFTGMSDSNASKKKKKIFFILFASFLLVAALVAVVSTSIANSKKNSKNSSPAHAILRSSCSVTRFPELCFSTVTNAPGAIERLTSKKDVIETIVNLTLTSVEYNYFTIKKIIKTHKGITVREKYGLHDCLEMVDETRDELHEAREDLEEYPNNKKNKSLSEIADDLKMLLSGAMTNQETCLDGFSHEKADKVVREILIAGQIHVYHMCSNALAMIKSLTDEDIKNEQTLMKSNGRKLIEDQNNDEFPAWLSVGDRKLLQSGTVTPDATVAADGSGNFRTVAAAVAAAPARSTRRYVIRIKAGVYRENVEVPKTKTNLMFLGDGRKNTIITGSRNVVDGSTTFNSATVAVVGERFLARGVTFQNTAGPSKHQAVALRVGSDFSAFYECDVLAYQDTLYVHSLRQFYINCLIAGTVDFIFGNAAVVLQDCDIHARRPNNGQRNMLTAQGRDDPNQNTGIVIQKCRIGATSDLLPVQSSFPTYLGRPWKEYSRTIVMQSTISNVIHPAGWFEWNGNFALNTLFYAEYQNTGAGAGTSGRVKWRGYKVITSATEAQTYTAGSFLQGSGWLGSTGFPFSLAL